MYNTAVYPTGTVINYNINYSPTQYNIDSFFSQKINKKFIILSWQRTGHNPMLLQRKRDKNSLLIP